MNEEDTKKYKAFRAKMQKVFKGAADTDLFEVSRDGVSYKATGVQLDDQLSPWKMPAKKGQRYDYGTFYDGSQTDPFAIIRHCPISDRFVVVGKEGYYLKGPKIFTVGVDASGNVDIGPTVNINVETQGMNLEWDETAKAFILCYTQYTTQSNGPIYARALTVTGNTVSLGTAVTVSSMAYRNNSKLIPSPSTGNMLFGYCTADFYTNSSGGTVTVPRAAIKVLKLNADKTISQGSQLRPMGTDEFKDKKHITGGCAISGNRIVVDVYWNRGQDTTAPVDASNCTQVFNMSTGTANPTWGALQNQFQSGDVGSPQSRGGLSYENSSFHGFWRNGLYYTTASRMYSTNNSSYMFVYSVSGTTLTQKFKTRLDNYATGGFASNVWGLTLGTLYYDPEADIMCTFGTYRTEGTRRYAVSDIARYRFTSDGNVQRIDSLNVGETQGGGSSSVNRSYPNDFSGYSSTKNKDGWILTGYTNRQRTPTKNTLQAYRPGAKPEDL